MKYFIIHSMGCKSNRFEADLMTQNLILNGYKEVKKIEQADIFILNSCSVTHKSDNEAFYYLRSVKNKNPNVYNVLTGCIAQIEKEKLLEYDFIDCIIGNDEKLNIAEYINKGKRLSVKNIMEQDVFNHIELNDTLKTRASLKIQDGCDNRCAYCIIWKARGKSRSAKPEFIIDEINKLSQKGFKEVVLTGIHIGQWGKDFGLNLLDLLKLIETQTSIERYRLGSLNPTEIDNELLNFLAQSKKFCPHFHLSLQSANDKTLKSMNRFYKTEFYLTQIKQINDMFEFPFIGSDIIVGFAGETEKDFEITRKNLEFSGLTQIHTFPYSVRQGTIGESMDSQVSDDVKIKRANIVKYISKLKYNEFLQKNVGRICEVLIEKHRDKHSHNLKGVTRNYLSLQIVSDREDLYNTLQTVRITHLENDILYSELAKIKK